MHKLTVWGNSEDLCHMHCNCNCKSHLKMNFSIRPEFYRDQLKEIKIPETVSNLTFAF